MRVPGVPFVQGRNGYSDDDGRKYGLAIHNTSNDASASGEASYATRRTDGVSSHFYVDASTVIQSLDTDERAGHAGSRSGNENAVAVEITGTNAKSRQWWLDNVEWDKLGHALAVVCKRYSIEVRRAAVAEMQANPKVRAFYSHDDMRRAWGGTTHTDPGPNFPWDRLFRAVNDALDGDDMTPAEMLAAQIKNPITGENASVATFFQSINTEAYKARLTAEAVLAAVKGLDTKAVLARIDKVATAEVQRDQAAALRDAALAELFRAGQSGELAADELLRRLGELLTAGTAAQG